MRDRGSLSCPLSVLPPRREYARSSAPESPTWEGPVSTCWKQAWRPASSAPHLHTGLGGWQGPPGGWQGGACCAASLNDAPQPQRGAGMSGSLTVVMDVSQGLPSSFVSNNTDIFDLIAKSCICFSFASALVGRRGVTSARKPNIFSLHHSQALGISAWAPIMVSYRSSYLHPIPSLPPNKYIFLKVALSALSGFPPPEPLREMPPRPDRRLTSSFTIFPPAQQPLHKPWKQATQGPQCSGLFRCHFARSPPQSLSASSTMQPSLTTTLSYMSCSSNSWSIHCWDPSFYIPFIEVHQMCVLFSQQMTQNITTMQLLAKMCLLCAGHWTVSPSRGKAS